MRNTILLICLLPFISLSQTIQDNFEGAGTITTWRGDNCAIDTNFLNPFVESVNTSSTVLRYHDTGGLYANVQFDTDTNIDLSLKNSFSLKIYVPSNGITGNQTNQISLKLQNKNLGEPWSTQTEIIKPVLLNQWQEVAFDFENDPYINLNSGSSAPIQRTDFNRVVIQVNGENNNNNVLAYIDDLLNFDKEPTITDYDTLVWADEFDGTGAVDATKWFHQTKLIAGNSWANGEQQHYTNRVENAYVENGTLKIKAIKENYTDQSVTKNYTSARLNAKFAFKYGRVEVRAKLPSVAGAWPAIWLLGKNINEDGAYWDNEGFGTTSWPWCGEIDIMEPNIAKTEILATWHWHNGSGHQYNSKGLPTTNSDTSQNFHNYILEWSPTAMKIFMNNVLIHQMASINPFNEDFFILLNVAMGGSLGGTISPSFTNDTMEIDYVRVYQQSSLSIENEVFSNLRFYPNPTSDMLHVELPNISDQNIAIEVFDIHGRNIHKKQYIVQNFIIDFDASRLNTGLYFMKLIQNNGTSQTFKFIKK